jgi:hypothetical protein
MSDSEETIYSTMFKSLKHPVRRKILRVLSDKPTSFSDLLGDLGVSSSHLTYHLESLGELVAKLDGGNYKLSTFGEAAVNTMRIVEDAPVVQSQQRWSMSLRWKPIFAALVIAIVLLTSFSVVQFNSLNQMADSLNQLQDKNNQLLSFYASTNNPMNFLRDVIQLDLTKYDVIQLSNTLENPPVLGGMSEQTLTYSLTSSDSKMTVVFVFDNNTLSKYQLSLLSGSPIYNGSQPFIVLDSAKWLIQKLSSYENEPYLADMNQTLYKFSEADSYSWAEGNLKFNLSTSGAITEMQWYYTENKVDFAKKGFRLTFKDQVLSELDDTYFLYNIGNTQVNVDQAGAIQTAKNAVKDYSLGSGSQQVTGYTIDDATAVFNPAPREDQLTLIPCWQVTLYLGNLPTSTNINRIVVNVWADTGKADQKVRALSG